MSTSKNESKLVYSVKDDFQHVLDCSDVYVGDVGFSTRKEYIYDDNQDKILIKQIDTPEALIRIFVEVLTNAVDNAERSKTTNPCRKIKVDIDLETGMTSVWNDGEVIPIITNKEYKLEQNLDNVQDDRINDLYIHSMIFGNLRSSSNYEDDSTSKLSGKNGVGVKCTNIFSSYFCVTGVDSERSLKLTQEWSCNMTKTTKPVIENCSFKNGYTEVKYIPDFKRFNLNSYPTEVYSIFKKLIVDVSALVPDTTFWFCGKKINIKTLQSYSKLYYNDEETMDSLSIKYEESEVVLVGSESPFRPISFVNGQITKDGGQHVQSWTKTIFTSLLEALNNKKDVQLTKSDISPYFQFFIHSRVTKPKFDGQNKNILKNPKVKSELTRSNLSKILKWSIMSIIKNKVLRLKELGSLKKIEKSIKGNSSVLSINGYDSANNLGPDSILIVCEGLSAKSYAISGIQTGIFGKQGRTYFGILPLRGKFLNVKNVNYNKINKNKVICDLIQVLNLKIDLDYSKSENHQTLNYGTLLILTDADKDGIHIKGLVINFFHELYPTLFKRPGFLISMETPIIKVFDKTDLLFYDENMFENYRQTHPNLKIKYYKGLGSINPKDTPLFFGKKMVKYIVDFKSEISVNKVFKDENTDERKKWLSTYDPKISNYCIDTLPEVKDRFSDTKLINAKISDFMEHEMIKFSYEDCKRSLASCIDGLKESQRKVIYAIRKKFKSNKNDFIKVAQLSGYVAEQTDYKHGEQNLCDTIIKFAQNFVGSNNLQLLIPDGQFGTRNEGGKDASNSRYIFTKPDKILNYIFREEDDHIINYTSEGEPDFFVPILPLILINGSIGIGTGWSCFVPQYNPIEIYNYIYTKLQTERITDPLDLIPYYRNFKGKIIPNEDKTKFVTYGKMKRTIIKKKKKEKEVLKVTELPIGLWIDKFKLHCEKLKRAGTLKYENTSSTDKVDFTIEDLDDVSVLKLTSNLHTTNMVLFNHRNILTKYSTIDHIFTEYYTVRLHFYQLRKDHMIVELKQKISVQENKLKFILMVVENQDFLKKDEVDVISILENKNFLKVNNTFDYLLNIYVRNCTLNAIKSLEEKIIKLKKELLMLENTTINKLWLNDLDQLKPYLIAQNNK